MEWVYVIAAGERGEGHSPLCVYPNLDAAKAAVWHMVPGVELHKAAHHLWRATLPNGVDELWIYSMPVRGGGRR